MSRADSVLRSVKGLYIRDSLISPRFASKIITALRYGPSQIARVSSAGISLIDKSRRNSSTVSVPESIESRVTKAFTSVHADLERFFEQPVGDCQSPVFLRYTRGQFFRRHCDNAGDPRQPAKIRARRATAVLFLNSAETRDSIPPWKTEPTFQGGELIVYGLNPEPTWQDFYQVIVPISCRLVVFRADLDHEVTCIARGIRYSIVTWFESPRGATR
jgi:predicted 2-oxoglutarate/Fe(II)-dependent dioxygenase YbiX